MFPRYLQYLLTDFRQTFVTAAAWDTDDLITFLGEKVKVQGHTIAAEAHSTRRYRRVQLFLVYSVCCYRTFWWIKMRKVQYFSLKYKEMATTTDDDICKCEICCCCCCCCCCCVQAAVRCGVDRMTSYVVDTFSRTALLSHTINCRWSPQASQTGGRWRVPSAERPADGHRLKRQHRSSLRRWRAGDTGQRRDDVTDLSYLKKYLVASAHRRRQVASTSRRDSSPASAVLKFIFDGMRRNSSLHCAVCIYAALRIGRRIRTALRQLVRPFVCHIQDALCCRYASNRICTVANRQTAVSPSAV